MSQVNPTSVTAGVGDDVFGGRTASAVFTAARTLTSPNTAVQFTVGGLNTEVSGIYPTEGAANDLFIEWCVGSERDPVSQRSAVGGAPAGTLGDSGASTTLQIYDEAADNMWALRNPYSDSVAHCYDGNAVDGQGIHYKSDSPQTESSIKIHRYDLRNEVLLSTLNSPAPSFAGSSGEWNLVVAICWFPTMGPLGSLIVANSKAGTIMAWSKYSQSWTLLGTNRNIKDAEPTAHYNPTSDRVIVGANDTQSLTLIDNDGTLSSSNTLPAEIWGGTADPTFNNPMGFLAAPNSNHSLLFRETQVYPLDTSTGVWQTPVTLPASLIGLGNYLTKSVKWTFPELNCIVFQVYGAEGTSKQLVYRYL